MGDQPRDLILMDLLALLSRDPSVRAVNHTEAEWQRRTRGRRSSRNCIRGTEGRKLIVTTMMIRKKMMR